MQSKRLSLTEAITNTLTGLVVSFLIQLCVYGYFSITVTIEQNIYITLIFTMASIVRSYLIRRIFNKIKNKL